MDCGCFQPYLRITTVIAISVLQLGSYTLTVRTQTTTVELVDPLEEFISEMLGDFDYTPYSEDEDSQGLPYGGYQHQRDLEFSRPSAQDFARLFGDESLSDNYRLPDLFGKNDEAYLTQADSNSTSEKLLIAA